MLKQAQRNVPIAKPRGKPVDIEAGYERAMARFPKIIARLAE
nr:J438 [uncultured bacterium]